MIVDQHNAEEMQRYDDFVRSSPYRHFSQDSQWSKVKDNWIPEYVYVERDGQIAAAMSVLLVEAQPGAYLMYANRGPVCDFYDIDLVEELIQAAQPLAEKYPGFLLRMDPEVLEEPDLVQAYRDRGYIFRSRETELRELTQPRWNMVLDLQGLAEDPEEDDIIALYGAKTRNKVRSSYRKGVETTYFEAASCPDEALDAFYEQTQVMAERQGITHRPRDYFKRLLDAYPSSRLYLTRYEDTLINSAIVVNYGNKLVYLYSASSNEHRNVQGTYQMQHEAIKWAVSLGKKAYDFGGVFSDSTDDGLYRYKQGFTGEEGLYAYVGELDVVYDDDHYQKFINK